MNFVGIIAEYDPFHSGHALQLRMLRQRGASTIAVCMSTGVVQRGGVPILPEAVRVRAALAAGADLVVALPAPYANASAEQFAAAGVHLLAALGCDTLAFGAETPEPAPLQAAAAALCSAAFPAALRSQLESGLPFAAARAAAAETLCPGAADLLQTPNNILGIEYCKAILRQGAAMQLLPLPRLGAAHGTAQTPAFMNVGTQGAIKGAVSAHDLKEIGCQIELSNTYHLHLRPGDKLIKEMGGLHRFMRWDGPILTDSGGFQVFSLASMRKIKEEGVTFASHIDGRRIFMGPEESMQIQSNLGSDIAMAFDECVENPAPYDYVKQSCERTLRWLQRCKVEHDRLNTLPDTVNPQQQLFGINQGGIVPDLRVWHMKEIAKLDCDGYAIGGLAVGEPAETMYEIIDAVEPYMPTDKPRYLMGVGTPVNILEAVARGVDMFDCVLPARNARHGKLYTWQGAMNIKNEKYKNDDRPIDPACDCPACRSFSRAYLRHLFAAGEMLGMRLAVIHNLHFYNELMVKIRQALEEGRFTEFYHEYKERLGAKI